jgi:hypothetical protein
LIQLPKLSGVEYTMEDYEEFKREEHKEREEEDKEEDSKDRDLDATVSRL